jgi:hypothetical protein
MLEMLSFLDGSNQRQGKAGSEGYEGVKDLLR